MINNRILLSTFLMLSSAFALNAQDQVTAKETKETIPTYLKAAEKVLWIA